MRSFLTIFALLLVAVSALRRGPASPKQWYPTPYGWGFENIPDRSEEQPTQEVSKMQEKAMKEVKRGASTQAFPLADGNVVPSEAQRPASDCLAARQLMSPSDSLLYFFPLDS